MNKTRPNRDILCLLLGASALALMSQAAYAHGMSEEEKQAIVDGGNLAYLWLGATHMLSGYDHLAFVFGIIFFLTSFRDIARYITAFTLGHSVTLIGATFMALQINYFLIDAVIALSVSYIAFSNIDGFRKYLDVKAPNMMFMIVALGLIHGCGLSTRLQQLPLAEGGSGLLMNIISFNAGVEIGQVSALAVMLIVIAAWRKREGFAKFSLIANYALIAWGLALCIAQMHGFEHSTNAEELAVVAEDRDVQEAGDQSKEVAVPEPKWNDTIQITIPARGDKEYKLYLEKDAAIEYEWKTDGVALFFDFHGEPAGDSTGYFKSFKKNTSSQSSGELTAFFEGRHGWYWKNTGTSPVVIELRARGAYKRLD